MEAKELRIGNLFQTRANDIRNVDIKELTRIQRMPYLYKPIPLTEEWLVKFGFDNLGAYGWGIGYFHIRFRNIHKFHFPLENRLVRIKYVHQLQNLYFALTNEELIIK